MANTRTMLFNPTRIPLLLPPPPRPRSLTTVSSSWVGFTPIAVHRRQSHHTFPVWKTKRTKMYGSLTPAASPDNGKTETSVKGEDHEVEYCSGKEEEDQSKNMIEHIKKVYGVLGVELLLYGVGYTIIAMNPPLIAFVDRNALIFAGLWFSTLLCMLPLPSKLNQGNKVQLKCIYFGVFIFCGILLNGLYLARINVTGRTVITASVSALAMVSALTMFTFWAYGKRYYKLGIGYFLQFSSFVTMSTFLFAVFKQKFELGLVTVALGVVAFMLSLICTTERDVLKLSKVIQTCLNLHFDIYGLFFLTLNLMLLLQGKYTTILIF